MHSLMLYNVPQPGNKNAISYIEKKGIVSSFSRFPRRSRLSFGATAYMYQTKDRMNFVNEPRFKGKTFYHVTNPFEHVMSTTQEKNDIQSYSKLYFGKTSLNIVSRAFYKMWEILMLFDPVPQGKLVSAHLAEAPGSFVQSLMFYREKFFKNTDTDEHYTISIDEQDVPAFKKDFKRVYPKVKIYEQDGGDLTTRQSIIGFERFSKKADFITADGGFNWRNENHQEQEAYRLILGEIISAFKIQKAGGTFVIKMFETYTDVTINMMYILCSAYSESYIFKPFTSRASNSEKYIVCKGFKGVSNKVIDSLLNLLEEMNDAESQSRFISTINIGSVPEEFINMFSYSAIDFTAKQFIAINKMVNFVESNEYYGSQYQQYLKEQQDANDYWVQQFYPIGQPNYKEVRKILQAFKERSALEKQEQFEIFNSSLFPN